MVGDYGRSAESVQEWRLDADAGTGCCNAENQVKVSLQFENKSLETFLISHLYERIRDVCFLIKIVLWGNQVRTFILSI